MVYGKTAVLITHRLASTMITDKIFVMHEGKITESGTHNELMELNGIYCNMFTEQKNWYEEEVEANE